MHENDDRTPVPGRSQVPERDVEPLWPPEEIDGVVAAPPWAAPAQPAAPPWPLPPADAPVPAPQLTPAPSPQASPVPPQASPAPPHAGARPSQFGPAPGPAASGSVPVATTPGPGATNDPPAAHEGGPITSAPAAGGGDAPANGRAASPWAQPPQRTTPDAAGSAGPVPAPALGAPVHPHAPGQPAVGGPVGLGAGPSAGPAPVGPTPADAPTPAVAPTPLDAPTPVQGLTTVDGPTSIGTARVAGPHQPAGPDGPAEDAPPRLGPFPPSPGVPMQQPPPYGNGTAYPPVPYPQQPGQTGQPGWYPPGWPPQTEAPQAGGPAQQPAPIPHAGPAQQAGPIPHAGPGQESAPPQPGGPAQPSQASGPQAPPHPLPPGVYPEPGWTPQQAVPPTAEDFARRRQARPVDPVATMGVRAVVNRTGLVRLAPGRHEQELKRDIEMVRRNFGGLRQVTVVNPKGGAGKTVAILLLAMTFGQKRGGYVLAWDNNETQGTLGMRAQQDFHARTVRDMLRDLGQFQGAHGRVGDLSQYVRSQGEGMFDVLASDESATGGEMLTAAAFAEIREVVSRFYKLIFVDTGNNVRAQNWQAAMDATDQLVVTMSARNDSAETAARMLDHLEQSGRQRLVRQAVTVVSMPPSRKEIDLPAIQAHFAARTRAVLLAPYERLIDTGEPLRYGQLSTATRDAWLKIAASVAEGL
ncbi:chromosome partitioning protein [Micromonospora sp. WMMC241]|uniref:chromosome partitioning protein n=1 Tax=Micromonospora sp. WMMC241 TaxID=3015159 RepID=UPI003FA5FBDA